MTSNGPFPHRYRLKHLSLKNRVMSTDVLQERRVAQAVLFRIGDAIASRNVHAGHLCEAPRYCVLL